MKTKHITTQSQDAPVNFNINNEYFCEMFFYCEKYWKHVSRNYIWKELGSREKTYFNTSVSQKSIWKLYIYFNNTSEPIDKIKCLWYWLGLYFAFFKTQFESTRTIPGLAIFNDLSSRGHAKRLHQLSHTVFKPKLGRAGDMGQGWIVLATVAVIQGFISRAHKVVHTLLECPMPVPGDPVLSSDLHLLF